MSGSGSDGGGGGGGVVNTPGNGPPRVPCDELTFDCYLASPAPDVVARLVTDDILNLQIGTSASGGMVVEARTQSGDVAGSISAQIHAILECIQAGFAFVATVISVNAGAIRVHVSPMVHG